MKNVLTTKRVLLVGVAVLLAGGAFLLWYKPSNSLTTSTQTPVVTSKGINYGPPTAAEKAESDAANNAAKAAQSNQATTPANTKKSVNPIIVNASQASSGQNLTVSVYVGGIIEDGGTCTLTLTQPSGTTITKTTTGFSDATKTDCPPFTVNYSEFSQTGNWTLTVNYSSNAASGSATQTVTIK